MTENGTAYISTGLVENEGKLCIREIVDINKYNNMVLESDGIDVEMWESGGCSLLKKLIKSEKKAEVVVPVIEGQCINPVVEKRSEQLVVEKIVVQLQKEKQKNS